MKTNLNAILAALGVAALLAAPAAAKTRPEAGISTARGSAAGSHAGVVNEENKIRIDDCVHVAFPQCSGLN